jgi:zinc protease
MKRNIRALLCALLLFTFSAAPLSAAAPKWPHEGSDLKPDPAVTWGNLPNGLRYAIMQHREPAELDKPNRKVSLRLHIRAGSLMEQENERGLAHFLEHMAFNGTKHYPAGEMQRYFQRLGMSFGAHTNAYTTFDRTVYELELPADAYLDDALTLFRDYADGMLLAEDEINKERGVILSELLDRDGPGRRTLVEDLKFSLPDSLIPHRHVDGLKEVIRTAPKERFVSFYQKWYTPDRMTLVIVGPVKPSEVAAKLAAKFGSMKAPVQSDPDLGKVTTGRGLQARLHTEMEAGKTTISIQIARPYDHRPDNKQTRSEILTGYLANAMLNQRLERLTSGGQPPFLGAGAGHQVLLQFAEIDGLEIGCKPDGWEKALIAGMHELRRALKYGFTETELREAKINLLSGWENAAQSASTRSAKGLADQVVDAVNDGDVFTHPAEYVVLVKAFLEKIGQQQCLEALRKRWNSPDISVFVHGNLTLADSEQKIKEAFLKSLEGTVEPLAEEKQSAWAYTDFGSPGRVVNREEVKDLGLTLVTFGNNVRLSLKPTPFKKDSIRVNVNFGGGALTAPKDKPGLITFAANTFLGGGLEKHSLDQIVRLLAGNSADANFSVGDEFFTLSGATTKKDLAFQMQLLCACLTAPGYREDRIHLLRQGMDASYDQMEHDPEGIIQLNLGRFLRNGDVRFAYPQREEAKARTMAEVKEWLSEALKSSWLEIGVVGDFEPEAVISAVAATFGALPDRAATRPDYNAERVVSLAAPQDKIFHFTSKASKAYVVLHWPTTDSREDYALSRQAEALAEVLGDRVREKIREELGQTYTPNVSSSMSTTFAKMGGLTCEFSCEAKDAAKLGQIVREIAGKLAAEGATQDELDGVKQPLLKADEEVRRNNLWWMSFVGEAQSFPRDLERIRTRTRAYENISLADINRLAKTYLPAERSILVLAVPDAPSETSAVNPATVQAGN